MNKAYGILVSNDIFKDVFGPENGNILDLLYHDDIKNLLKRNTSNNNIMRALEMILQVYLPSAHHLKSEIS